MSQTVTMTEFLRNPKKVRDLVKKGIKVFVMYEGEIVMVITFPKTNTSKLPRDKESKKMPTVKAGLGETTITREDIYDEESWLNKPAVV